MAKSPQLEKPCLIAGLFYCLKRGAHMKWLLIAMVVIADKFYDRYFDEADDE